MPNTKISNLTTAAALTGSEVAPIVQSSNTVKVTTQNIANLALPSQTGNANKYLQTNGTTASWDAVDISTADISGTLPIANGGTGQTSAANAINALLPSQTGNNGKYLTTNGTSSSWATVTGGQNYKTYAVSLVFAGGSLSFSDIYNDTGLTFTFNPSSVNGRIEFIPSSPISVSKTIGFIGNVRDILTGTIGICYNQRSLGTSFRFEFVTPAGTLFDFTTANVFGFMAQLQIYP